MDIKEFIENYEDKDGRNPFVAGMELLTFVKSIPLEIAKVSIITLLLYAAINTLLFLYSSLWLFIVSLVVGFIFAIALIITGSIKNISTSFIENVSEFVLGTLGPISDFYTQYKEHTSEEMTKKELFNMVLKEAIVPAIEKKLSRIPFKNRLKKRLHLFTDHIEEKKSKSTSQVEDELFMEKTIENIEDVTEKVKRKSSAPFSAAIKTSGIFVGIIVLIVLLQIAILY